MLEHEIGLYLDLIGRAQNLNEGQKQEMHDLMKQKCGVQADWNIWRKQCREKLEHDESDLDHTPHPAIKIRKVAATLSDVQSTDDQGTLAS